MSALMACMPRPRGTSRGSSAGSLAIVSGFDMPVARQAASVTLGDETSGRIVPHALCGVNAEFLYDGWCALEPQTGVMRTPAPVALVGPTSVRYPGGSWVDGFDWTKAVGPTRPPMRIHYRGDEDVVATFGVDELLALCDTLSAEPLLQVDMMSNDPASAAALVKHVNGDRRRCSLWELGNEEYHSDAGTWRLSQEDYVARGLAYISAMQAAQAAIDGSSLKIYAVIHPNTAYNHFSYWEDGGGAVVAGLASHVTGFAVHRYGSIAQAGPDATGAEIHRSTMLWPAELGETLDACSALMALHGAADKSLLVTEWGITHGAALDYPYANHVQCLSTAAAYAGALNEMARRPQVTGAWCFKLWGYDHQGLVGLAEGGASGDSPGRITPAGLALGLWRWAIAGKRLISAETAGPMVSAPQVGWSRPFADEPALDALAAMSPDGAEVALILVNRHPADLLDVTISPPPGFKEVDARILWGRSPDSAPGTDGPIGAEHDFRYTAQANVWRFDRRKPQEIEVDTLKGVAESGVVKVAVPPGCVAALQIRRSAA